MAKGKDRDRRREAQWRRVFREYDSSGLTIRAFCRKSNLHESAFYFWRRELQCPDATRGQAEQEQRERTSDGAAFVPVHVAQEPSTEVGGRIEIELSGGMRVHVTAPVDRAALADVLAVMEARPC